MTNLFLRAYSVVAQAIAQNTGVTIKTGNSGFSTDGNNIYVPTIDEHSIGPLIHEVAHIRVSNFNLQFSSAMEKHVTNVLEDVRIEQWISIQYPGAKMYLADMAVNLVGTGFWGAPQDGNPTQLMQQYMLYRLRADVLGQVALLAYSNEAENMLRQKVSVGTFVRLEALMYGVEKTSNTRDVQLLAQSIIKMMEEEAKKEEEEKEKEKEKQQQQQSDPNQDPQQPQDQSDSSGAGDDQQDDQNQPQAGGEEQQDGKIDPAGQAGSGSGSDEEEEESFLRQVLQAGEGDGMADIKDALTEACATAIDEGRVDTVGVPFPTKILNNPVTTTSPSSDMLEMVQTATNALKVKTGALLQAETKATKRNVLQGTRIDPRKLHRAPTGGAIFQKVTAGKKIDTAVMVLIDRSGSMEGEGIYLATQAALASSLAFNHRGVETAVMAFPYMGDNNVMLKSFKDRAAAQVGKYEALGVEGCTPMAEAMMGAGIELAHHRFQRKILLVATDGDPDNLKSTKEVISLARRSNMEVIGIGINLDVSHVFGKEFSSSVNDINDLPNAMIEVLSASVFK